MSQIVEASQMLVDQTPVSRPPVEQLRRRAEVLRRRRVTIRVAVPAIAAALSALLVFVLLPGGRSSVQVVAGPPPVPQVDSPLTATWTPVGVDSKVFPPGAQVNSVVSFKGRLVAAGAVFGSCGTAGEPACGAPSSAGQALTASPVVWTSPTSAGKWARTWDAGGVVLGSGTIQQLVVGPRGLLLFDWGTAGTALWASSDAKTWSRVQVPEKLAQLMAVDVVVGRGLVMAVVINKFTGTGGDQIWLSRDGISWTAAPQFSTPPVLNAVAVTPTGFVVGGVDSLSGTGRPTVWTSADGTSWYRTVLAQDAGRIVSVAAEGSLLVAAGTIGTEPHFWWSLDGRTWTAATQGGFPPISVFPRILPTDSGLITTTGEGSSLWSSITGRSWTLVARRGAPPTSALLTAATPMAGGLFVFVQQTAGSDSRQMGPRPWRITLGQS
jgi:(2Fe-2S) ferredoxin